ncbi:MAG: glycosyltransferase family 4 protein [Gemmatimonadota bacterium]|nr:glycosyltransferase family 4 protein [Gemmatimonadota bacterium]
MRVLFLIGDRIWSGRVRAFAVAADGLRERGHQVAVVCPPGSDVESRLDPAAYELLPLNISGPWPAAAARIRRAVSERFVEVIFVHTDREQLIASAAARSAGRAAVLRRVSPGENVVLTRRAKMAMRFAATGFVFASESEMRNAGEIRGTRVASVFATSGADANAADSLRGPARALAGASGVTQLIVCAYDRTSRIRAAPVLRVASLLAPRHPDLRVAVVGPGSTEEELRMHAAALRITKIVRFLGDRPDAFSVLRAADLGWVVAQSDDGVFAMLDLMAARVPVLAERSPVTEQYIADGITGVLFDRTESAAIAAPVARLLAHDDERSAMASAGRARVARDFPLAQMIDGFERAGESARGFARW